MNQRKKLLAIIGARPQFIKHYPFERETIKVFDLVTIHTGQHYDKNMSQVFFDELGMRSPDYMLSIGSANHGTQTGLMMIEIEKVVLAETPDAIVVYGDTNSTLAGALVASKLQIPLFHIEAGLRSYNKEMPEEINRILTDHVSDLLFVPSTIAKLNLKKEGITNNVIIVGDIMKDLVYLAQKQNLLLPSKFDFPFFYATLHRPYNTDKKQRLQYVLKQLNDLSIKVIFSIHPRTVHAMKKFDLNQIDFPNIEFIHPQSYFNNLSLLFNSKGLITDSGGMQKEAYWLNKNCVTIRKETEWVETLEGNCNKLMFEDISGIDAQLTNLATNFDNNLYGHGVAASQMIKYIQGVIV